MDFLTVYRNNLKKLRKNVGLTQEVLARECGISRVSLLKIERGSSTPSLRTVIKIAETLHLSPGDFFK